ncbi:MAG: TolC family protein, partial [Acidobacteriaceae bacterium]
MTSAEQTMYKGFVLVMWFCVSPLWSQQIAPPELLPGVASRPPLKLEDFLVMADRNNPTLRQAQAVVRRSEAEARQASLYPNPSVGYEGDQIRGGSY